MNIEDLTKNVKMTEETKLKIERLINLCSHSDKQKKKHLIVRVVDEILSDLFKTEYSFVIPYEFMETELGTYLFNCKYTNQYYYPTYEVEIILNRNKSNLYFHRDQGHLRMINRGARYEVTEKELRKFMMAYEQLPSKEIDKRLDAFWEIKNQDEKKLRNKSVMKRLYEKALSQ